jgi:hypothetical protein
VSRAFTIGEAFLLVDDWAERLSLKAFHSTIIVGGYRAALAATRAHAEQRDSDQASIKRSGTFDPATVSPRSPAPTNDVQAREQLAARKYRDIVELRQQCADECGPFDVEFSEQFVLSQPTVTPEVRPGSNDRPGGHQLRSGAAIL